MHEPATIYIYLSTNGPLFRFQMDYSTSNSNICSTLSPLLTRFPLMQNFVYTLFCLFVNMSSFNLVLGPNLQYSNCVCFVFPLMRFFLGN